MKLLRRRNNPKPFDENRYRSDMRDLVNANPDEAADVLVKWRNKFNNALMETANAAEKGMELGSALGATALIAYFDGKWEREAEEMITKWEAGDYSEYEGKTADDDPFELGIYDDPAEFLGFDVAAWYPIGLAAIAYFGLAGDYSNLIAAGAIGSGSYYVGTMVKKWGYEAKDTELKGADKEENANTGT